MLLDPQKNTAKVFQATGRVFWKEIGDLDSNLQEIKNDSPIFTDCKDRNFVLCEQFVSNSSVEMYKPIALAPDKP
jgi:hypothetical protein